MQVDAVELGQVGGDLFAHPLHQARGVGVAQPGQVVEPVVVEPGVDRLEQGLDVAVVDRPAQDLIQRGGQVQPQQVAVAVQAAARVAVRGVPQLQGALEALFLPDAVMTAVDSGSRRWRSRRR